MLILSCNKHFNLLLIFRMVNAIGTKSQFQIGGENGSGLRETIPMVDLWVDTVHGVYYSYSST